MIFLLMLGKKPKQKELLMIGGLCLFNRLSVNPEAKSIDLLLRLQERSSKIEELEKTSGYKIELLTALFKEKKVVISSLNKQEDNKEEK